MRARAAATRVQAMTVTLITGADKGLGHEAARQLCQLGHTVWMGVLDPVAGARAARTLGARFVVLDVDDDDSVAAARETIEAAGTGLDVIVNNAGIGGGFTPVADVHADDLRRIFETNVFGVVRVLQAFAGMLERSENPVVVNVSSGMGSFGVTSDVTRMESKLVGLAYPSSKTALNMLTTMYAKAYPQMRINAVDPGQTATDMTGGRGAKTVAEGASIIVEAARLGPAGPTGSFLEDGGRLPW